MVSMRFRDLFASTNSLFSTNSLVFNRWGKRFICTWDSKTRADPGEIQVDVYLGAGERLDFRRVGSDGSGQAGADRAETGVPADLFFLSQDFFFAWAKPLILFFFTISRAPRPRLES